MECYSINSDKECDLPVAELYYSELRKSWCFSLLKRGFVAIQSTASYHWLVQETQY